MPFSMFKYETTNKKILNKPLVAFSRQKVIYTFIIWKKTKFVERLDNNKTESKSTKQAKQESEVPLDKGHQRANM